MVIHFYKNGKAVQQMKKLSKRLSSENVNKDIIAGWYIDKVPSCYFLYEDDVLKAFALVSKCDFDPMGKHSNPHVLNYIYTLQEYRKQGHALELIGFIKNKIDFSCFCMNDEANNLFSKAGCQNHGPFNNTILFRHP